MLLLPLRDRVQSGVDRVFFRTAYDFRKIVEEASTRLASVADLGVISSEIDRAVTEALHPEWMALYVRKEPDAPLLPVEGTGSPPTDVGAWVQKAAESEFPFEIEAGELAVPFRAEGRLVALLQLGRRLSGRFYGGDARRLLHTLANQGAVAIENALALEKLQELNRDLEDKVKERTRELAATLDELRRTQAQLVHREKMASVGQFVAGIHAVYQAKFFWSV